MCELERAVLCEEWRRWFCSRGGLELHRSMREEVVEDDAVGDAGQGISEWSAGNVAKSSAENETSRDTSAFTIEKN